MRYKIVYRGEQSDKIEPSEIAINLSQLLGQPTRTIIQEFFINQSTTVKSNLSEAEADHWLSDLTEAGITVYKEPDQKTMAKIHPNPNQNSETSKQSYNLCYRGELSDNIENSEIIQNLVKLLKIPEEQVVRKFFINKRLCLHRNVSYERAANTQAIFQRAGVILHIEKGDGAKANQSVKASPSKSTTIEGDDERYKALARSFSEAIKEELTEAPKTANEPETMPPITEEEETVELTLNLQPPPQEKKRSPVHQNVRQKWDDGDWQKESLLATFSLRNLLSINTRSSRLQFITRIIALIALMLLTDRFLNPFYYAVAKHFGLGETTAILLSLGTLITLAVITFILLGQRLHDLGLSAYFTILFLFPLLLFGYGYTLNLYEQNKVKQEIAHHKELLHDYEMNRLELHQLEAELATLSRKAQRDNLKRDLYREYRLLFIAGYLISSILLVAMVAIPGNSGVNRYGSPPERRFDESSLIMLITAGVAILLALIAPLFFSNYLETLSAFNSALLQTFGVMI